MTPHQVRKGSLIALADESPQKLPVRRLGETRRASQPPEVP
jgi:hypothetical protein